MAHARVVALLLAAANAVQPRIEIKGRSYKYVASTGMYKLDGPDDGNLPRWFDPAGSQERLWIDRGWGVISDGSDENDERAEDFVGLGKVYEPAFLKDDAVAGDAPLVVSDFGFDATPRPPRVEELSDLSADVLLRGATEPPHKGVTADGIAWTDIAQTQEPLVFSCAASGLPVFSSEDMFVSPSGWPSFTQPIAEDHVTYVRRAELRKTGRGGGAAAAT